MMRLKWLGAAAALATVIATPVMAQEATQEPGMIGFNYPNSRYVTGGWGVHTPPSFTGRRPQLPYGGFVAYDASPAGYYVPGDAAGVTVGVGPAGVSVGPAYDAYGYEPY